VRAAVAEVARDGPARGPVLSEDPLVALLAGERPAAVDRWMLRLAAERDPGVRETLAAALEAGGFRAVVVLHAVDGPGAEAWFAGDLGLPALEAVRRGYGLSARAGLYHVRPTGPTLDASFAAPSGPGSRP
jgi:hypothetical protein